MTSPVNVKLAHVDHKEIAGQHEKSYLYNNKYCESDDDDESFHSLPPLLEYEEDLFFEAINNDDNEEAAGANSSSHLFESAHSMHFIEEEQEKEIIVLDEIDSTSNMNNIQYNNKNDHGIVTHKKENLLEEDNESQKVIEQQKAPIENTSPTSKNMDKNHHNSLQSPWKVVSDKIPKEQPQINSISFNHEKNCISIGTSHGFIVRTIHPKQVKTTDQRAKIQQFSHQIPGGIALCEMLHSTSLLALVKISYPRILTLIHAKPVIHSPPISCTLTTTSHSKTLCEINFSAAIRHIELNRQHFFVLTADAKLHIFDMKTLKRLKSMNILVLNKEPNRWLFHWNATTVGAFLDVSIQFKEKRTSDDTLDLQNKGMNTIRVPDKEKGWIVCKSSEDVGMVNVYDASDLRVVCKTKAHEHSIARIAIGGKGVNQKFATASLKGTVIRVFSLPQCEKLYTLWRGSGKFKIHSLSFDPLAKRVAVSASSGIIYLYKLEEDPPKPTENRSNDNGETNLIKRTISSPAQFLYHTMKTSKSWNWASLPTQKLFPTTVKDTTDSLRCFSKVRVKSDYKSTTAIATPISITKGQSNPNIVTIVSSTDFIPNIGAGEDEDLMIVATADGKLLKYAMNRRTDVILLKDVEDLILDQDDEEEHMNGIVHPQVY